MNAWTDRKLVGVVNFGVVAVVNSATTAECSVAWFGVVQCRIIVVVVVVVVVLYL